MEQAIFVNGKRITLKATAGALIRYRQQFGIEYIDDLQKSRNEDTLRQLTVGFNLIWAMAKTANNSTPPPEIFLKNFANTDILSETINIANKLFEKSMADLKQDGESGEKLTSENLIALCMCCGLSTTDIDNLSMSLLLNSISEYNKIRNGGETGKKSRKATQADFDAF